MVCKCCVPEGKSNYESAGKEGRCSTFGFPLDETKRQNWLRNIPRQILL